MKVHFSTRWKFADAEVWLSRVEDIPFLPMVGMRITFGNGGQEVREVAYNVKEQMLFVTLETREVDQRWSGGDSRSGCEQLLSEGGWKLESVHPRFASQN